MVGKCDRVLIDEDSCDQWSSDPQAICNWSVLDTTLSHSYGTHSQQRAYLHRKPKMAKWSKRELSRAASRRFAEPRGRVSWNAKRQTICPDHATLLRLRRQATGWSAYVRMHYLLTNRLRYSSVSSQQSKQWINCGRSST